MGTDRALVSQTEATARPTWAATGSEPRMFRGYSVDSAKRRRLAIFAGRISLPLDLLAAVATLAGGRCVAGSVACLLGALDENGLLRWDETFLDGSFAPAKKGASPSAKPSAARARSGWYWQTVKVFRWEFGWKVPLRQKLRLRKPHWRKSASPSPKAHPGKIRSG